MQSKSYTANDSVSSSVDNYRAGKAVVSFEWPFERRAIDLGNVPHLSYGVDEGGVAYFRVVMDEITVDNLDFLERMRAGQNRGVLVVRDTGNIGPKVDFRANVKLVEAEFIAVTGEDWSTIEVVAETLDPTDVPWILTEGGDGW